MQFHRSITQPGMFAPCVREGVNLRLLRQGCK
jgi:hypothetical protein